MRVISIQSHVAEGHVGNSAAVFPMQRLGVEVVPVHTLQFSNHPGHGAFRGRAFEAAHVAEVLEGLEAHGALKGADAILTGHLGSAEIAGVVAGFVERARRDHPGLLYLCDPVIGDRNKGLYVPPALAATIRDELAPRADVLLPNAFELEWLTGETVRDAPSLRKASERLLAAGTRMIVATSLDAMNAEEGQIVTALIDARGVERLEQRRLPRHFNGAGDCFAGLFTAYLLMLRDGRAALGQAGAAMASLLAKTWRLGRDELALVQGQGAFRLRPALELGREPGRS